MPWETVSSRDRFLRKESSEEAKKCVGIPLIIFCVYTVWILLKFLLISWKLYLILAKLKMLCAHETSTEATLCLHQLRLTWRCHGANLWLKALVWRVLLCSRVGLGRWGWPWSVDRQSEESTRCKRLTNMWQLFLVRWYDPYCVI